MEPKYKLNTVVLQPTSLCNLNCRYCYLPDRAKNRKMSPEITRRLASDLVRLVDAGQAPLQVVWHGGEPLATGYDHFARLIEPLAKLEQQGLIFHSIQTNGTLLDERWCDFFKEHRFEVGLSLDGPAWATSNRVDWQGREAFPRILRGIEFLKQAGFPVDVIAVVPSNALDQAAVLYRFFAELGCASLAINLEDQIGTNQSVAFGSRAQAHRFWTELYQAWRENPVVEVREIEYFNTWWETLGRLEGRGFRRGNRPSVNLYPTIGWQGDVVFLSPEFNGAKSEIYHDFVIGNIVSQSLDELIEQVKQSNYLADYLEGKRLCRESCPFYSFCVGGYASQKYFELGTLAGTETNFCRNSRQELVKALSSLVA